MPKIFTGGSVGRLPLLIMITVLIQLNVPGAPLVADETSQQVSVAVFDLTVTGNMEKDNAVSLSNLLQAAIKENAVFDVVERDRLQDVQQEQMRQLSGGIEEAVEIGKMHAAQQLLIGSVGKLFDNIVITVRLVETETGRIIAADTIYTDKQFIETDIKKLAVRLATKSLDYTRPISLELINSEIEQENFRKAKRYIDIYIQRNGVTPRVRELRDELLPRLAEQYADDANRLRKDDNYEAALSMVQEALALRIDEKYVELQDKIIEQQEEHQQRIELNKKREAQKEKERALRRQKIIENGRLYPLLTYYRNLSLYGLHILSASSWVIDEYLNVPSGMGELGIEIYATDDPFTLREGQGRGMVNNMALLGGNITYIRGEPYSRLVLSGYVSPYLTAGIKLANLGIIFGLDGGGSFEYNNALEAGYRWAVNGGAHLSAEIKIKRSFGLSVLLKGDYQYYPDAPALSRPLLRVGVGLVF